MINNKKLTLSIVIPVFNEEDYLEMCLRHIAVQTVTPDEVIVVDNNSTDKTTAVAKSFPFVRLMRVRKQGVLFARNRGFDNTSSDIIGRIDADTVLPQRWVEHVKKAFADESVAAVTGPVNYYDMPFPATNHKPDHLMRRSVYNWSPKSPFLFGSNMAVRSHVWRAVEEGLCADTYMHEDLDLAIHLYKGSYKIFYTKKILAGASGRRYTDKPSSFYTYMSMYRQTYLRHNLHSLAIYSATGVYWLGYVLIHPWLNTWYGLYGVLNPLLPLTHEARKNPMSS
jgi:glycosyltransferase involved in cell wall biosynthesis